MQDDSADGTAEQRGYEILIPWLVGTHHGVSTKHLQAYLNEFAFRYNSRRDRQQGFLKVLQISTEVEGPEYEKLYSAGEPGGWVHVNPEDEN